MKAWITKYKRWLWWGAGMLALCAGVLLGLPAMMEPVPQEGVSLPVLTTTQEATDAFESFRAKREEERKADRASLEKLLERDDLDAQTLEDVAAALQRLVTWNEEELALEGALTKSRISPCLAVRSEGMVTVVTEKESLSEGESALLLTLCEAHTGVSPEGVKVICTGSETK